MSESIKTSKIGPNAKGAPLTSTELDNNFIYIDESIDKLNTSIVNFLPVPKIKLISDEKQVAYMTDKGKPLGFIKLNRYPVVIASDFSKEFLKDHKVCVEMLVYKRGISSGFVVPAPYYVNGNGEQEWPSTIPWPQNFYSRAGSQTGPNDSKIELNRPNHYLIESPNSSIPVWEYLNGRFMEYAVAYRNESGYVDKLRTLIPISGYKKFKNKPSNRFPYSSIYTPYYFAFRYVVWDPFSNEGKGQIISGPISKTIKLMHTVFPFNTNQAKSQFLNKTVAIINKNHKTEHMKCWVESNLP